jgi:hypothetical protein
MVRPAMRRHRGLILAAALTLGHNFRVALYPLGGRSVSILEDQNLYAHCVSLENHVAKVRLGVSIRLWPKSGYDMGTCSGARQCPPNPYEIRSPCWDTKIVRPPAALKLDAAFISGCETLSSLTKGHGRFRA